MNVFEFSFSGNPEMIDWLILVSQDADGVIGYTRTSAESVVFTYQGDLDRPALAAEALESLAVERFGREAFKVMCEKHPELKKWNRIMGVDD